MGSGVMSDNLNNPNFPDFLNIHPSPGYNGLDARFNDGEQRDGIQRYGIAGRIW
jgi:hypothetical protein